jgi:hypothetical protein
MVLCGRLLNDEKCWIPFWGKKSINMCPERK